MGGTSSSTGERGWKGGEGEGRGGKGRQGEGRGRGGAAAAAARAPAPAQQQQRRQLCPAPAAPGSSGGTLTAQHARRAHCALDGRRRRGLWGGAPAQRRLLHVHVRPQPRVDALGLSRRPPSRVVERDVVVAWHVVQALHARGQGSVASPPLATTTTTSRGASAGLTVPSQRQPRPSASSPYSSVRAPIQRLLLAVSLATSGCRADCGWVGHAGVHAGTRSCQRAETQAARALGERPRRPHPALASTPPQTPSPPPPNLQKGPVCQLGWAGDVGVGWHLAAHLLGVRAAGGRTRWGTLNPKPRQFRGTCAPCRRRGASVAAPPCHTSSMPPLPAHSQANHGRSVD